MSLLTNFWLQRMDALARSSPGLYYTLLRLLAYLGYAYLLLFPLLAIALIAYLVFSLITASPYISGR